MLRVERVVVAAVIHQVAALSVYAAAQPEPRFSWYNGSSLLAPVTSDRYDIVTASHGAGTNEHLKNSLYRHSSTLTLSDVQVWDLTEYRVVVDNDYGSNYTTLRLVQASECNRVRTV